jgi:serine protease Do
MASPRKYLLPSLTLAVLAPQAWADKDVVIRRLDTDSPHHVFNHRIDENMEKEKVTYLGVTTGPVDHTLSSQLGLPKDTGLVVGSVMEKSPAAEVLKPDDILTRFNDQILIDTHQLSVLVRSKKEGEEVKLTLLREGKEMSVKVKLGVHEVPKLADAFFYHNGGPDWQGLMPPEGMPGLDRLRELPGMGPEEARDVLHMIEHERGNFLTGPRMRIHGRAGSGSTILDLPKSNISYSDDEGSIEIKVDEGKRHLTVKNAKGEVAFAGPINTEEERKNLPKEVSQRLEKLDSDTFEFEVGEDFKPDVVPLPPGPAKTKISHHLGRGPVSRPGRDDRSF